MQPVLSIIGSIVMPTHLHEAGTDLQLIQALLGHNDLKTTLRYLSVTTRDLSKIKSPFDDLDF